MRPTGPPLATARWRTGGAFPLTALCDFAAARGCGREGGAATRVDPAARALAAWPPNADAKRGSWYFDRLSRGGEISWPEFTERLRWLL